MPKAGREWEPRGLPRNARGGVQPTIHPYRMLTSPCFTSAKSAQPASRTALLRAERTEPAADHPSVEAGFELSGGPAQRRSAPRSIAPA